MGIAGFYSWIAQNYPSAVIKNVNPLFFDHIYIDLNYLLHMYFDQSSLDKTLNKVQSFILELCKFKQPLKSINLCADGSAPLAKLFLQRKRRMNETLNLTNKTMMSQEVDIINSSLNLTPGCNYMNNIHIKINKLKTILENTFDVDVIINNLECGEAEIKIKHLLLQNINRDADSSHLFVTNDADVLLILSSTLNYHNIYVLMKSYNILSIRKLLELHTSKYGKSNMPGLDFCFINLLNGNDYLPKLKFSTTNRLWESYKIKLNKHKQLISIVDGKISINKKFLIDILFCFAALAGYSNIKKTKIHEYSHNA